MKTTSRVLGLAFGLATLVTTSYHVKAQEESCPVGVGWAEGLNNYTNATIPFPTKDTANVEASTDCIFHQWSWEAFVWATAVQPNPTVPGSSIARFLTFPTPDQLKPGVPQLPGAKLKLKVRGLKPKSQEEGISSFQQAGPGGVLVDQNGNPAFYSVHLNPTYFKFVQKYYSWATYSNASPTLNFPVGSAVFKASWRIVSGSQTNGYYTIPATVPLLVNTTNSPGIMPDPSGKTRDVTVALIGLHVVGVTENHPEFVWGTFEHTNNAPSLKNPNDWGSTNAVSPNNYAFYKAGTPAVQCNQIVQLSVSTNQIVSPITSAFLQYTYGGGSSTNQTDIVKVNTASQSHMAKMTNSPAEQVYANYALVGTVWLEANTLQPGDGSLDTQAKGSVDLANATMETFVQGPQGNCGNNASCFMCHNTSGYSSNGIPGKNINTSHVILDMLFNTSP